LETDFFKQLLLLSEKAKYHDLLHKANPISSRALHVTFTCALLRSLAVMIVIDMVGSMMAMESSYAHNRIALSDSIAGINCRIIFVRVIDAEVFGGWALVSLSVVV
jgi:hypothetical protein